MTSWLYNHSHSNNLFLRYRNTIDFLIKLVYSSLKFIFNFLLFLFFVFFVHKQESTISTQLIKSKMKNKYMNVFTQCCLGNDSHKINTVWLVCSHINIYFHYHIFNSSIIIIFWWIFWMIYERWMFQISITLYKTINQ